MRREQARTAESLPDNDNRPRAFDAVDPAAKTADRFRRLTIWLILFSALVALGMILALRIRVDSRGTSILECLLAALLLASRMWWNKAGHVRMADACGTVAVVALGGMTCGAIAMVGLREEFPLADDRLRSFDHMLGVDGIGVVENLLRQGEWIFWIMAPAYNFTIPIFFGGLILLARLRDRVEAWRAAFCFVGTLLTTCLIAMFVPAKGIGVWAPQALLEHLPPQSMRSFWAHFDEFYFGADPVLRMQVVDGVVSFPLVPLDRRLPRARDVAQIPGRLSRGGRMAPLHAARHLPWRRPLFRRPRRRICCVGRLVRPFLQAGGRCSRMGAELAAA